MDNYPIIDSHTHLWDVLNLDGGSLIGKTGIPNRNISDRRLQFADLGDPAQWAVWVQFNHGWSDTGIKSKAMEKLNPVNIQASTKRNAAATLENCIASMDAAWVDYQIALPIPPYLTFDDLTWVHNRIIPFTGVDFTQQEADSQFQDRIVAQFANDILQGAKWLKIHPILQMIPLVNKRVSIVMEAFSQYNLPMLSHAGHANYYKLSDTDAGKRQAPEHWLDIDAFVELATNFPHTPIIVWHSGITSVQEVIAKLAKFPNVHVDTSFQWTRYIHDLIQGFWEERILWASDWPFWARSGQKKIMEKACEWNPSLRKKVFFSNANQLMQLGL